VQTGSAGAQGAQGAEGATGSAGATGATGPAGTGSDLLIYDDSVFQVTGTAISFNTNLNVFATGSVAFVEAPITTYQRVGESTALNGDTGATWVVPDGVFASGSLSIFIDGVAQQPDVDYAEMFYVSGTYRYLEAPATGTVHLAMYGVPCSAQVQVVISTGAADGLADSDVVLMLDSDGVQLLDSDG